MHDGMVVKLITKMAGPGGVFLPGSIIEVTSEQAKTLIDGGFAKKDGEQINGDVLRNHGRKHVPRKKG